VRTASVNSTALTTVKTVAFAPMPAASMMMAINEGLNSSPAFARRTAGFAKNLRSFLSSSSLSAALRNRFLRQRSWVTPATAPTVTH
jgi:hypothetical protein